MEENKPEIISRRHQLTIAVIVGTCLMILGLSNLLEYARHGRRIDIERPFEVQQVDLKIDLNNAEWPELTLLPDISETMARRIVEFRQANGPFASLDDIQQVKGIGPRTFARIERYLSPVVPLTSTAVQNEQRVLRPSLLQP